MAAQPRTRIVLKKEQTDELDALEAQASEADRQLGALLRQLLHGAVQADQIAARRNERCTAIATLHGIDTSHPEIDGVWQHQRGALVRVG